MAVDAKRDVSRPYRVIAGLVLSFSVVTLVGSALLSLLHLPQDVIRWVALAALVAIGLGLIFPQFEQLLERPFARIPQKQIATRAKGFGLGLALGVLYVPCARTGAGRDRGGRATANIGLPIVMLPCRSPGHRGAVVVFRFCRSAGCSAGQRFSASSARVRVIAGVVTICWRSRRVQPACDAAASDPRLHHSLEDKLGSDKQVQQLSTSAASSTTRTKNVELPQRSENRRIADRARPQRHRRMAEHPR